MNPNNKSIGIFDSGFGGLTVMSAISKALPHENIIYLGDTAHLPYGNKSKETLIRYSLANTHFLTSQGIKLLIIACNTACSAAFNEIQEACPVPIIGIVEQGVQAVTQISTTGKIGLLATRSTIAAGMYQKKILEILPQAELTLVPCPLFVSLIEEGYTDHPLTRLAIQEHLHPLKNKSIDSLLLGCTHYPLLDALIRSELGADLPLIDPAELCAQKTKQFLSDHKLLNPQTTPGHYQFFVSEDPEKFAKLGPLFLNRPIDQVSLCPFA